MKKIFLFTAGLVLTISIYAQPVTSLQLNGGILLPNHAQDGFALSLQLNHGICENITLYFYSGYSVWNKNKIIIQENMKNYSGNTEDDHFLIPVYIGGKWNFNMIKTFGTFVGAEIGYNFLSYNKYGSIDFLEGPLNTFQPVRSTKESISESKLGIGISLGITQTIAEIYGLTLVWKMNNLFRSLNDPQTVYSVIAGFIVNL